MAVALVTDSGSLEAARAEGRMRAGKALKEALRSHLLPQEPLRAGRAEAARGACLAVLCGEGCQTHTPLLGKAGRWLFGLMNGFPHGH